MWPSASPVGDALRWVSKLPTNALGKMVRNRAREMGVDVSQVIFSDQGRQGLYFVEYGPRPGELGFVRPQLFFDQHHPARRG